MRKNLPKTFSVLKFCINLLNFSLKNISQIVKINNFVFFLPKISKYLLDSLNTIFPFYQNGTFEPVHEIQKFLWPKDFF